MTDGSAPLHILVVDDDEVDREAVRRGLGRAGLSVAITEATSGDAALAVLSHQSFDCVFLDYNLPRSNGVALLAAIRRAGHEVPVIALTGQGDEHVAVELMKAGAADYLAKSDASAERLAASVRYATELARAQEQARAAEVELRASAARSRFLAEASAILVRSLDVQATLARVARLAVPALGDYCLIYLQKEHEPELVAAVHRDSHREAETRRAGEALISDDAQLSAAVASALRGRHAAVFDDPTPLGTGWMLVTPFVARSAVGAAVFGRCADGPPFQTDDIALAEDLASRAAAAIENARLYQEADDARRRTERLQRVTAKLAAVLSQREVADVVVAEAREALGAEMAWLALLSADGRHLNAIASYGVPADVAARFAEMNADDPTPARETLRSGEPVFFASWETLIAEYPHLRAALQGLAHEAMLVLPLSSGGVVLGLMTLGFRTERTLAAEEVALGLALARQCAQSLERARLYEAERAARSEAETARREAEEANRAKSDFLARMSHDLRTPLNAIGGYAQLIEEGIYGEPTPGQRESLARIRRAKDHLLTLINDVLSFAKLEAGQVRLTFERVPVRPTLETLSLMVQPQAASKSLTLRLANSADDLTLRADEERTMQVMLNLLTNAIKFTEPGGSVTLSADRVAGGVAMRVSDTGRGIAADRLELIFDPFVQGGQAGEERQGVGLGLAIGRELARMMGGELSATSQEGQGSTFVLTLPSADAEA